jgi:hypothetical protein
MGRRRSVLKGEKGLRASQEIAGAEGKMEGEERERWGKRGWGGGEAC